VEQSAGQTIAEGTGTLVDLKGAGRHYEIGGGTLKALDQVDLTVSEGEFVVILGPSGSGKTTLLNLIGALDTPTVGSVEIAGQDLTRSSRGELFELRRKKIGFIFQSFNLFPGLTAIENVRFGADIAGRQNASEAAIEVLEQVGLADRADHFPHELSGGEQQRVAIARALVAGNPIVLADEPTGELDFHTGVQILELLHSVTHTADTAVLIVTHNRQIARIAHRIIELSSGRIESDRANEPADMSELHW
jgi:putative ABC transport system ATP-binding protein